LYTGTNYSQLGHADGQGHVLLEVATGELHPLSGMFHCQEILAEYTKVDVPHELSALGCNLPGGSHTIWNDVTRC